MWGVVGGADAGGGSLNGSGGNFGIAAMAVKGAGVTGVIALAEVADGSSLLVLLDSFLAGAVSIAAPLGNRGGSRNCFGGGSGISS